MTKSMKKAISLCLFSMGAVGLMAQSNEFKIDVQKTGAPIQSTMYGIFFEDINFGADGGLYAELIKNRSFEFENPFGGWMPLEMSVYRPRILVLIVTRIMSAFLMKRN